MHVTHCIRSWELHTEVNTDKLSDCEETAVTMDTVHAYPLFSGLFISMP